MKNKLWIFFVWLVGCIGLLDCQGNTSSGKRDLPSDYSRKENWMKIGTDTDYEVDVIYYYPTAYFPNLKSMGLYCSVDHPGMRKQAQAYYDGQIKMMEEVGNIYIPWYRQANPVRMLGKDQEAMTKKMKAVPYEDVKASFEYYLQHYNQGKPFILAGHSQGATVLKLLMEDYMKEHPEVLERMVVAYLLGFSFEKSFFEANPHLKFAEGETDTGVIASWNCERKDAGKFGKYNHVCYPGALCINPVTWKHDYEPAAADDERFLPSKNFPDLRCSVQVQYDPERDYEVLILGIDTDEYDQKLIGDQNLHMMDFNLFTENIRANARKRIEAFQRKNTK